jgi:hypothetical protein
MTIKELSQLYWLNQEIAYDQQRLEALEQTAKAPATANMDGMPHGAGDPGKPVERIILELTDLQAIIAAKRIQCIHERQRLERYIAAVPDSLTRKIMTLRFVEGQSWNQVAAHIGGGNSTDAVKKRVYRYLETAHEGADGQEEVKTEKICMIS